MPGTITGGGNTLVSRSDEYFSLHGIYALVKGRYLNTHTRTHTHARTHTHTQVQQRELNQERRVKSIWCNAYHISHVVVREVLTRLMMTFEQRLKSVEGTSQVGSSGERTFPSEDTTKAKALKQEHGLQSSRLH